MKNKISNGLVHKTPADLQKMILSSKDIKNIWEDITPLARNEWICWIESAKKLETRTRRIEIAYDKFIKGIRRPCCWSGCTHRPDK